MIIETLYQCVWCAGMVAIQCVGDDGKSGGHEASEKTAQGEPPEGEPRIHKTTQTLKN